MSTLDNMTKQQLLDYIGSQQTNAALGLMVKKNKSGGVYIKANSFVEHSVTKNKDYVAGLNIGINTAKSLFNNPELLEAIREQVNKID